MTAAACKVIICSQVNDVPTLPWQERRIRSLFGTTGFADYFAQIHAEGSETYGTVVGLLETTGGLMPQQIADLENIAKALVGLPT